MVQQGHAALREVLGYQKVTNVVFGAYRSGQNHLLHFCDDTAFSHDLDSQSLTKVFRRALRGARGLQTTSFKRCLYLGCVRNHVVESDDHLVHHGLHASYVVVHRVLRQADAVVCHARTTTHAQAQKPATPCQ